MKDSQDWLDILLADRLWFAEQELNAGQNARDVLTNMKDELEPAIRKHILQEAMEIIGSMPKLTLKGKFEDDMGLFGDYVEIAELRNKFNDKYKED